MILQDTRTLELHKLWDLHVRFDQRVVHMRSGEIPSMHAMVILSIDIGLEILLTELLLQKENE